MLVEQTVILLHDEARKLEIDIHGGVNYIVVTPKISSPITLHIEGDVLVLEFHTVDKQQCRYIVGDLEELD